MSLTERERKTLVRMVTWMMGEVESAKKVGMNVGQATLIVCRIDALASYFSGSESESASDESSFTGFVKEFMSGFTAASTRPDGKEHELQVADTGSEARSSVWVGDCWVRVQGRSLR